MAPFDEKHFKANGSAGILADRHAMPSTDPWNRDQVQISTSVAEIGSWLRGGWVPCGPARGVRWFRGAGGLIGRGSARGPLFALGAHNAS